MCIRDRYGLPPEPDREKYTDSQYDAQEKRSCRYNLAPCCSSLEPRPVRLRAAALAPPCPIPRSDPLLSPCSPPIPYAPYFLNLLKPDCSPICLVMKMCGQHPQSSVLASVDIGAYETPRKQEALGR